MEERDVRFPDYESGDETETSREDFQEPRASTHLHTHTQAKAVFFPPLDTQQTGSEN